jgi:two-component system, chemotaxis family, sensor kinase Cph1
VVAAARELELATNAASYGALSVPEGDLAVAWTVERVEAGAQLLLEWVERSGPPVTKPAKRGFGNMLIERALSHDLSGKAEVEFLPEGVRGPLPDAAGQSASATGGV